MKEGIHPAYHEILVECACGNSFKTRSTASRIRLDICSNCHPFYTGQQKLIDTAGRVERFQKRFARTEGRTVLRKPSTLKAAPAMSKKTRKILRNTPRAEPPPRRGSPEGRPSKSPKPASR